MAKRNKERSFLTELKRSFEAEHAFFYKISDMPHFAGMTSRFDKPKPFDAIAVLTGIPIAIEAKSFNDYKALNISLFRHCQVKGLDEFAEAGGKSYVFLNVRRAGNKTGGVKRVNRLYAFNWLELKRVLTVSSIKKDQLMAMPYVSDGAKDMFSLSEFLKDV